MGLTATGETPFKDFWSGQELIILGAIAFLFVIVVVGLVIAMRRHAHRHTALEERYRCLVDNANDIIYTHDLNGLMTSVNPAGQRITGYNQEDVGKFNIFDLLDPADHENARRHIFQKLENNKPTTYTLGLITKGGQRVPLEVSTRLMFENGKPVAVQGIARDVSERQKIQADLENHRRFIETITRTTPDFLMVYDLHQNKVVYQNRQMGAAILGYSKEESDRIADGEWKSILHPEDRLTIESHLNRVRQAGEGEVVPVEYRMRNKDGGFSWLLSRYTVFTREPSGQVKQILCATQDITAAKQAEERHQQLESQLRQAQKMEAVGQLAAGVAHDFNNLLTVIQGNVELLKMDLEIQPSLLELVGEVENSVERASTLTRQLLMFSRRQIAQPQPVDINSLLRNLSKMLGRLIGENIQLDCQLAPSLPPIYADLGMLEQIVMNLAVNARDAMPDGGNLRLSTERLTVTPHRAQLNPDAREGEFLCLTISDTGCGMDGETMNRMFEPFFTTKEVGQGTGLGLATVYGIVQQHQGWIETESQTGHGTVFRIFLPFCSEPSLPEPSPAKPGEFTSGTGTLMVVEDEPSVRSIANRILQHAGYQVLTAQGGADALELWNNNKDRVELLLTDLVMPGGIHGVELARRLRLENPRLKVIYCSGYDNAAVQGKLHLDGTTHFLRKPYAPATLLSAVKGCLEATGTKREIPEPDSLSHSETSS